MPHPLEIQGPPPAKKQKYMQPRFPQIGPAGDGPRVIMAAQSGMGKTSATAVFFKEYLRIVDRVHLVSGTIHLDPAYKEMKRLVEEKYKAEGIDVNDAEENPFHEDLKALPTILAGMVERTRQAQQNGPLGRQGSQGSRACICRRSAGLVECAPPCPQEWWAAPSDLHERDSLLHH